MTKKLSLIAVFAIFSMFVFVSCGSDDEDGTDMETGDTQSDTDVTDSDTDTTDTTDPTNPTDDPTNPTDDPTNPTDDPTNPTDDPTNPTDDPTNPTDEPTNPTDDPTDPTDDPTNPTDDPTTPGEGGDNLNTGDTSGNQAQSGKVGAPCNSDSQCTQTYGSGDSGQEAFCLTQNDDGFPGGYCSFMCDMTDHAACDNAGGVYHANSQGGWGDGYCYHKCTKPSDCRVGYRCSNKIHACLPDCDANECVYNTVCDETDKVCL